MIIGYLRVSTEKQHPANQQDEIRRFAESKQLIVNHWVTEVASGKKSERDRKLGVLLRRLKRDDTLIVTEISRSTAKFCVSLSDWWRRSNVTLSLCVHAKRWHYGVRREWFWDGATVAIPR